VLLEPEILAIFPELVRALPGWAFSSGPPLLARIYAKGGVFTPTTQEVKILVIYTHHPAHHDAEKLTDFV
jgi:hypothetical protein